MSSLSRNISAYTQLRFKKTNIAKSLTTNNPFMPISKHFFLLQSYSKKFPNPNNPNNNKNFILLLSLSIATFYYNSNSDYNKQIYNKTNLSRWKLVNINSDEQIY